MSADYLHIGMQCLHHLNYHSTFRKLSVNLNLCSASLPTLDNKIFCLIKDYIKLLIASWLGLLLLLPNVMEHRSLLVVYVFNFYQTLRVVPHGMKGTGPRFVTRPVYLRSQFRNNTNTVSTLVLLIHLLRVHYRFFVHGTWVSHHHRALQTSGWGWADSKAVHGMECSGARSLYWRSLSVGAAAWSVPYCQYREVCSPTRPSANKPTNYQQRTNPRSCARVVYIASDSLRHQPMGAGHNDCAPVAWAYGIPCPAMVSPNAC